jgi:gliding motility-associated-like protein
VVTDTLPAGVDTAPGFAATPGFATPPYTTKVTVTKTNDKRIVIVYTNTELLKGETVDIIFPCKVDSSSPKSYINRAYITYTEAEYEKNSENNTDTALVEVRGLINLKMDMALCRRDQDPTEYPRGYKFRQGDVVYLKVSVLNNGRETSTGNTPTALTINPSDGNLGSFSSDSLRFLGRLENVQYFPVNTDKCGKFSISADATINYTKPGAKEPTLYRDSAKVANIIILPSADVRVNIEVDPPGYDYNIHRAYTIKLKNIGRFRADTVMLTHKLDANIVSLDSVDVTTLNGFSLRLRKGLWQGKDLDSLVSKGPTRERLTYSRFDSTLTYTLDAVGSYWGEASVRLFVTTVEPSWDTVVKILPDAEAYVYQNWDNNLHNNKGYGSWIRVLPNPYNVSISIASEEEREDLRNVAGADVQMTFTITAKNIGRLPAMGTIFYDVSSGLVISNVDNAPVEAEEVKADSLSYEWKISPQLGAKDSLTFKVTVAPENASSKGQKLNIVRIEPVFSDNPDDKDADMSNNADTAYLNLFSVLDSWPLMEAFSPNGDGKNDRFFIPDLESGLVKEAKIVILNRYGSEVYYNSDYKTAQQSESAAFTGAGLPEGSYFYQLTVHFSDGSVSKRGGIITLRRSRWR